MPQDFTEDKSKLVQVMAWCRQQVITWTSVDQDLQRHMPSLGPNELSCTIVISQLFSAKDRLSRFVFKIFLANNELDCSKVSLCDHSSCNQKFTSGAAQSNLAQRL